MLFRMLKVMSYPLSRRYFKWNDVENFIACYEYRGFIGRRRKITNEKTHFKRNYKRSTKQKKKKTR